VHAAGGGFCKGFEVSLRINAPQQLLERTRYLLDAAVG
jgi:hypothetical protein